MQLGWVEEIGSGFANVQKWIEFYVQGTQVILSENDIFKTEILLGENLKISFSQDSKIKDTYNSSTPQVKRLLLTLKKHPLLSKKELMQYLNLRDSKNFEHKYLAVALSLNLIERTQPNSPNSPTQKYRLT